MNTKLFLVVIFVVSTLLIVSDNNTRHPFSIDSDSIDSPSNYINSEDLHVFLDKVIIEKENLIWAKIKDTHSMEPVLNSDSITLETIPTTPLSIKQGDIISYLHGSLIIIHRVILIGEDEYGWYAITKGDNNQEPDPYKVRFSQIKGLVVGILY